MTTIKKISTFVLIISVTMIMVSWKELDNSSTSVPISKTDWLTSGSWAISKIDRNYVNIKFTIKFYWNNDVKFTVERCGRCEEYFGQWWWSRGIETINLKFDKNTIQWNVRKLNYYHLWFIDESGSYYKFTKK